MANYLPTLIAIAFTVLAEAQTPPLPLRVTKIDGLKNATVIDNRSQATRANTTHTFCASGTGSWTVQIQYSDGPTPNWINFTDGLGTVSNTSGSCVGSAQGYHDYIRFYIFGSGTATVSYAGTKDIYLLTTPTPGGAVGGDLSGSMPNPTVVKINGVDAVALLATKQNVGTANTNNEIPLSFVLPIQRVGNTVSLAQVDLTTTVRGVLPLANGGTGTATPLAYSLPILKTGSTISLSPVDLTNTVTGVLPKANGGTGTLTPGLTGAGSCIVTGIWPIQVVSCPGTGSYATLLSNQSAAIFYPPTTHGQGLNPNVQCSDGGPPLSGQGAIISVDPGFELGSDVPNYWVGPAGSSAAVTTAAAHLGTHSVAITLDSDYIYQTVFGLTPGRTYRVEAYVRGSPGVTATGMLLAHDGTGGASVSTSVVPTSTGWTLLTLDYTVTATGNIGLQAQRGVGSGTVYVDDVALFSGRQVVLCPMAILDDGTVTVGPFPAPFTGKVTIH